LPACLPRLLSSFRTTAHGLVEYRFRASMASMPRRDGWVCTYFPSHIQVPTLYDTYIVEVTIDGGPISRRTGTGTQAGEGSLRKATRSVEAKVGTTSAVRVGALRKHMAYGVNTSRFYFQYRTTGSPFMARTGCASRLRGMHIRVLDTSTTTSLSLSLFCFGSNYQTPKAHMCQTS
jgi:hypothetical protein